MAAKVIHDGNWQLSTGTIKRIEIIPSGAEWQLILKMKMDNKSVTQFATMNCGNVNDNACTISRLCEQPTLELDLNNNPEIYLKNVKKCLNKKISILLKKENKHWVTVGIGKMGALDSFWFFSDNEPQNMLAHVREEYLKMLPNLPKERKPIKKI